MSGRPAQATGSDRDVRRAWWSLALFVPSTVAAFVIGEGLAAAFGYADLVDVPVGVALAAGLPAILVFALPVAAVWYFGHRAVRRGHPQGRVPIIVAAVVGGGFLALNLLQLAMRLVL
ncbi:hypothetical protein E8D34_14925 [Nocardioides sp. GY 10113]|uniref:hypothetical protein n=1 Tax=Nocardioides sp. GY 10113 TaxID=2569761 RepID=UPI0010A82411|nr:hypothetical protein [Nocardioides sp. GY 10113]TIC83854.1 hypothetical protein E8D34_14925 [Nocardioides sp. GY 10113]